MRQRLLDADEDALLRCLILKHFPETDNVSGKWLYDRFRDDIQFLVAHEDGIHLPIAVSEFDFFRFLYDLVDGRWIRVVATTAPRFNMETTFRRNWCMDAAFTRVRPVVTKMLELLPENPHEGLALL